MYNIRLCTPISTILILTLAKSIIMTDSDTPFLQLSVIKPSIFYANQFFCKFYGCVLNLETYLWFYSKIAQESLVCYSACTREKSVGIIRPVELEQKQEVQKAI